MDRSTILLKSKKSKYLKSFISSSMFMILSTKFMIMSGSLLWLIVILFFALATVASLVPMFPNQSYIKIDDTGLRIRTMFKTIILNWKEVEAFYIDRRFNKPTVAFSLLEKKINYLNMENIFSSKEVLPDCYGMEPQALADLLEKYRIRFSC